MKECPRCGRKFNLVQRLTGEAKDHALSCTAPEKKKDMSYLAGTCRGCPANCFDKGDTVEDKGQV